MWALGVAVTSLVVGIRCVAYGLVALGVGGWAPWLAHGVPWALCPQRFRAQGAGLCSPLQFWGLGLIR